MRIKVLLPRIQNPFANNLEPGSKVLTRVHLITSVYLSVSSFMMKLARQSNRAVLDTRVINESICQRIRVS